MTLKDKTQPVASARPRRTPLGVRQRIALRNKEAGYEYRIVNANLESDPDRVEFFIEEGWEIVPKDKIGPVGDKRVDTTAAPGSSSMISVGQGTKAVVMRIREDWYKENQARKHEALLESEQTMKRNNSDYGDVKLT